MVIRIETLIAFFMPIYLLSEIYCLIKIRKITKLNILKIATSSTVIAFIYFTLNIAQIQRVLVYLLSIIVVFTAVHFIIKIFNIKVY